MTDAPLAGITVVSLEQAVAAPYATRQLADLGARVVKIERPDGGDFARGYDRAVHGDSSYFVWLNRGKESLTLDLKHPEGRRIVDRLLDGADVLVQNLAPGAAARTGAGRRRRGRTQSAADRGHDHRLRRRRPVARPQGLRPAGAGRGRAAFGDRLGRRGRANRVSRSPTSPLACSRSPASSPRCTSAPPPARCGRCPCPCSTR